MTSLLTLPHEVLLCHLLPLLAARDPHDLCHLLATCRAAHAYASEPLLWKQAFEAWRPRDAALVDVLLSRISSSSTPDSNGTASAETWKNRFRAVYETRVVPLTDRVVVSRYNASYWCEVHGLLLSRTTLAVLFHVRGDNSLGSLQPPHVSMLGRFRVVRDDDLDDGADAAGDEASSLENEWIRPVPGDDGATASTSTATTAAAAVDDGRIEDGVTPPAFDFSEDDEDDNGANDEGSSNANRGDPDGGLDQRRVPRLPSPLPPTPPPPTRLETVIEVPTHRRRRLSIASARVVPQQSAYPMHVQLEINQRHHQFRGMLLYHASFLLHGYTYTFTYGLNGYSTETLFTLSPQIIAQNRLEHIVRSIATTRRLSHLLDQTDFVHAQPRSVRRGITPRAQEFP